MEKLLKDKNVDFTKISTPCEHYLVNSELGKGELFGIADCGLYTTKDFKVKVIIPNYSRLTETSYLHADYKDLYFGKAYMPITTDINTIFS